MSEAEKQGKNLDTLAIFHYVVGGLGVVFSLMPIIHIGLGLAIVLGYIPMDELEAEAREDLPFEPEMFGWIFVIVGGACLLIGQAVSICIILSGRWIKQRRRHLFSFILGCILCMFFPFGTVLGVFTIVLLNKDVVKAIYQGETSGD